MSTLLRTYLSPTRREAVAVALRFATVSPAGLQVHHYASGTIEAEFSQGRTVALAVETEYPWDGRVELIVTRSDEQPGGAALATTRLAYEP